MANNILTGSNAVVAKVDVLFSDTPLSAANTAIVFLIAGGTLLSYKPGRSINPITSMEVGSGYYIIAKTDIDLSDFVIPPIPTGSAVNLNNVLLTGDGSPVEVGNKIWDLSVNNAGALVTTAIPSGESFQTNLASPDGSNWLITVNNSGAAVTTKTTGTTDQTSFAKNSPDGHTWEITVSDLGVITTELIA